MDWCANSLSGPFLQEPGLFEPDVVMAQLRYSGVLETVRIRKEGFPVRLPFQVFIDRYCIRVVPELHRSFSSLVAPGVQNPGRTQPAMHSCSGCSPPKLIIGQLSQSRFILPHFFVVSPPVCV